MSNSTHAVAEERARPVSSGTSRMTTQWRDEADLGRLLRRTVGLQRHTTPTRDGEERGVDLAIQFKYV